MGKRIGQKLTKEIINKLIEENIGLYKDGKYQTRLHVKNKGFFYITTSTLEKGFWGMPKSLLESDNLLGIILLKATKEGNIEQFIFVPREGLLKKDVKWSESGDDLKIVGEYIPKKYFINNYNEFLEKLKQEISEIEKITDTKEEVSKKIIGLYFVDNHDAIKNTKEMISHLKNKPCTLYFWWHQRPEGTEETLQGLEEILEEKDYFYIYAIQNKKCVGRYKVEDFVVLDDPYSDKLPKDWQECELGDIWFDLESRKKYIDSFIQKDGPIKGTPRVLFKITEVKEFNIDTDKKGLKGQILPLFEGEIICEENMDCLKQNNLILKDTINNSFYNSLKTKGFVILAGLSGTGKTKIFEEFVKCFPNQNDLFFPIRPDFKDTKSLLGFYNPLKEEYHSTPLLNFVLNAVNNYLEKGNEADPFFVLFDEMNLARVEYYFADFLSVLEAKRFENSNELLENEKFIEFLENLGKEPNESNYKFTSQSIKLHAEGNNLNDKQGNIIPQELFLPPNLYFVGTVNIDETTHMFSPKVLDRAFTIEFDVGDFDKYLEFLNKDSENSSLADEIKDQLKQDFINHGKFAVIDKKKIKEFAKENEKLAQKLQDINEVLRKYNLHFGYRVFDEIMMFLYNSQNSFYNFNDLNEAFDLAIKMKVLPKFHGTRQKLEEPIIKFLKELELNLEDEKSKENEDNQSNPKEKDLIEEISKNLKGIPTIEGNFLKVYLGDKDLKVKTPYLHTAHKLLEMLYKLQTQGFASFM